MGSVRVAIVGVGNCASSLVQGVEFYKDADPSLRVPGLMHVQFGDYHVGDVEFVAAFDVDAKKVGTRPLRGHRRQREQHHQVRRRPADRRDRPARPHLRRPRRVLPRDGRGVRRAAGRRRAGPQGRPGRRARLLPAGGLRGGRPFYAQCCLDAKVAFVNALPVFIASDPEWAQKFTDAGVPIVGDDIKSQVGATITHRVMAKLFEDRGVELLRTYQLNFGGNMDFMNMLERKRLQSKKISKTQSVTSQIPHEMAQGRRPHRPVGPRAVARRPQVGLRPPRGQVLRRHPAEPGVQARGLGLPELRRRHHRRRPRREDRAGPRHRRPDPVGLLVLHEVARPSSTPTTRPPRRRGLHRRARSSAKNVRTDRPGPSAEGPGLSACRRNRCDPTGGQNAHTGMDPDRPYGKRRSRLRRLDDGPNRSAYARGRVDLASKNVVRRRPPVRGGTCGFPPALRAATGQSGIRRPVPGGARVLHLLHPGAAGLGLRGRRDRRDVAPALHHRRPVRRGAARPVAAPRGARLDPDRPRHAVVPRRRAGAARQHRPRAVPHRAARVVGRPLLSERGRRLDPQCRRPSRPGHGELGLHDLRVTGCPRRRWSRPGTAPPAAGPDVPHARHRRGLPGRRRAGLAHRPRPVGSAPHRAPAARPAGRACGRHRPGRRGPPRRRPTGRPQRAGGARGAAVLLRHRDDRDAAALPELLPRDRTRSTPR